MLTLYTHETLEYQLSPLFFIQYPLWQHCRIKVFLPQQRIGEPFSCSCQASHGTYIEWFGSVGSGGYLYLPHSLSFVQLFFFFSLSFLFLKFSLDAYLLWFTLVAFRLLFVSISLSGLFFYYLFLSVVFVSTLCRMSL